MHTIESGGANNNKNIRALRQAARSAATYDENLINQIIQKQLGDDPSGSRGGWRKKINDMAKEIDTEAMIAYSVGFPVDSLTEEEIEAGVVSSIGGVEQANYIIHGYINFGVAAAIKGSYAVGDEKGQCGGEANVVVIGAGLAGLAAAR